MTDPNRLRRRIQDALDRYDEEHQTAGCPARPGECVHSAAVALRKLVASTALSSGQVRCVARELGVLE